MERSPARGVHEFGPAMIEAARGGLRVNVIGFAGKAWIVVAFVAETHLDIQRIAASHVTAQHLLDFEPVLAVVLLEDSTGAECAHHALADRVLLFGRHGFVDERPGPDLDFGGPAWMPYAHSLRTREKRER